MHGSSQEELRQIAIDRYYDLIAILQTEKNIAKCLKLSYGRTAITIERNLNKLSFKKEQSTIDFINAASTVIAMLEKLKINASVLLLAGEQISLLDITQHAKELCAQSINVIAPQIIVPSDHEQFWDYVKADVAYVDFIVTYKADKVDRALLEDYAEGKEILEIDDLEDIVNYAKYCTLKKRKFKI